MLQPKATSADDKQFEYLKALHVQWENIETDELPVMWASNYDLAKYSVKQGDLLVCEGGEVGRAGILKENLENVIIQNSLHRVRSKDNCNAFLMYILINAASRNWFEIICNKATIAHFTNDKFSAFRIPLPPLAEQKDIAAFLDRETAKIDGLIAKKEQLIALLAEQRTALISRAVTKGLDASVEMKPSGVTWLGDVPAHWEVWKLAHLTTRIGSGKTPTGGAEVYQTEGVLFLRSQNVYDEGLHLNDVAYIDEKTDKEMSWSRTKPNDILLNITGASLGRTCLVPRDIKRANVNQHVCVIRLKENDFSKFVAHYLKSKQAKSFYDLAQTGSAREGLNFEQIGAFPIPLPPLAEQKEIAAFLDRETAKIDALSTKITTAIDHLKEYRTALISAAVTGKIDVREAV